MKCILEGGPNPGFVIAPVNATGYPPLHIYVAASETVAAIYARNHTDKENGFAVYVYVRAASCVIS